jgi:hypothetical protein
METIKATSETVACTLTREDLKDVRAAWQKLLRSSLISRDLIPGGLRLQFTPGGETAMKQLIAIEKDCCKWITFELDGPTVSLTAAGDGAEAIQAMWVVGA